MTGMKVKRALKRWYARNYSKILEGQERNAHEQRSRHANSQKKRSRHGHYCHLILFLFREQQISKTS
jgi:hypothetical protein